MKTALTLALALLVSASPAFAQAPTFSDARIDVDEDRVHVRLEATGPIGDPRVSIEPGSIRLRFADARDAHLDVRGDGDAIRFVRVRPGMNDAVVVVVRLGDMRELDAHSLTVGGDGRSFDVSIARAALAPIDDAAVASIPGAAVEAVPVEPAASEPVAEAEPAVEGEPETTDYLRSPPALLLGAGDASTTTPASSPATTLGVPSSESHGGTSLLLLVTAVLAIALLVVRWLMGRRGKAQNDPIRVLAAHRLSARHQLVVVRALGQDHLLSVDGAKTERLFSQNAPAAEPEKTPPPSRGMLDMLTGGSAPEPEPDGDEFTARLVAAAAERRDAPAPVRSSMPSHAGGLSSEAVAGLLRLRTRAVR